MFHGEHALHEVEAEPGDARDSGQLLPDERLFHGAVHVEDAVHGARGGRGRQRGPVHGLGRVMAAAAAVLVRMVVAAAFVAGGGVFVSGGQGGYLVTYEAVRVPGTAGA